MKKKSLPLYKALVMILHKVVLQLFAILLRIPVNLFIRMKFGVKITESGRRPRWGKPYLLLGDHVSYLDPFVASMGTLRPIHWIAADGNFRNGFMRFLLIFLVGAVAKTKNHSDLQSLMDMKAIARLGGIIGLFPEGEMSWHGKNLSMVQGTDKLVRFLKIPVVYCHMEGVYLSRPRWSRKARPRKIHLHFETVIGAEEVEHLSLSEIKNRINKAINYDEFHLQQREPRPLKGMHLAQGLERFLFTCPHCSSMGKLRSEEMHIRCKSCGWQLEINELGVPEKADPFETFQQWDLWQQRQLVEKVSQSDEKTLYWMDGGAVLHCGKPKRKSPVIGRGDAHFYGHGIQFVQGDRIWDFPLHEITGLNVFKSSHVEFLHKKMQYRIAFPNPHISGYKWDLLFKILMNQWKDPEEREYEA